MAAIRKVFSISIKDQMKIDVKKVVDFFSGN